MELIRQIETQRSEERKEWARSLLVSREFIVSRTHLPQSRDEIDEDWYGSGLRFSPLCLLPCRMQQCGHAAVNSAFVDAELGPNRHVV